ncbi:MAG: U32 family peptidase [bacterium]
MNNYIFIPNDNKDLEKLKGCKILYPIKFFSVGFNSYFEIDDITTPNSYLYINRLLTSSDLDQLKILLLNLPSNIVGIIFEDLGIYEITKNINIEKIFSSSHILTSSKSINTYLRYFDSCALSSDITKEEIDNILNKADKEICIHAFGHMPLSYSRRLLNTNYATNYKINFENNLNIENTNFKFIVNENEYGTVIYDKDIFSCLELKFEKEFKYMIINLFEIGAEKFFNNDYETTDSFLSRKTFYKVKGGDVK